MGSFILDPRDCEVEELGNAARIILRESLEFQEGQLDLSMLGWRELYQRLVSFAVPFPAYNEGPPRLFDKYQRDQAPAEIGNARGETIQKNTAKKPLLRIELSHPFGMTQEIMPLFCSLILPYPNVFLPDKER